MICVEVHIQAPPIGIDLSCRSVVSPDATELEKTYQAEFDRAWQSMQKNLEQQLSRAKRG
jgi:hypothetical protein